MKGKRAIKKARREWLERYLHGQPTDPTLCDCGHGYLEAHWHNRSCPVSQQAWAAHPDHRSAS